MNIYLTEPGMILKKHSGKYIVKKNDIIIMEIPSNHVECVFLYSGTTITSDCIFDLINKNVNIFWFNNLNSLVGNSENIKQINSELLFKQIEFYKNDVLCLELSKKIIYAKIWNGYVLIKRFNKSRNHIEITKIEVHIKALLKEVAKAKSITVLSGVEGMASRLYFKAIYYIVGENKIFNGRTRQPAKDPLNSLLNFGYSILYSEINSLIKNEGINPFYGFMHRVKNGHAALASDIIEEFRYQLVDTVAIVALKSSEFKEDNFILNTNTGGIYLDNQLRKKYISKIIRKLESQHKYMGKSQSYRETIKTQIKKYKKIITCGDIELYKALTLR